MSTAFFSPDIVKTFSEDGGQIPAKKENISDIRKNYEIERCREWINSGNYSRVAIQLPDELLCDSAMIVKELERESTAKFFILGDTSYGSCCVDEIAAQHGSADCILHFGRACLSPTKRLPVLYVFGQKPLVQEDMLSKFKDLIPDPISKIIIMYDTYYAYAVDDVYRELCKAYKCLVISKLLTAELGSDYRPENTNFISRCSRTVTLPDSETLDKYSIFYIGSEGLTLTNLMMNFNNCPFLTYDPETQLCRRETLNVSKALMKRYYMIERIKDASIVGIVAGTLGVADYLEIINRMKRLIKVAGKRSYTFVVGKLNVAKLANFMEIDVFVLVSCPENTLIDSSEFYKPVVTPFEVEVALNRDRPWTGDYITDFQQLLPGAASYVEIPDVQDDDAVTDVSLISNQLRTLGTREILSTSSALVTRNQNMAIAAVKPQTASEFLDARSWQGLEQNLGKTPVTKATEGMKGIAASYENETTDS